MKKFVSMFALCAMFCLAATPSFAAEKKEGSKKEAGKEVTIKGTATCAKCELQQSKACQAALKVKEDGKEVVYWVTGPEGKKLHGEVCKTTKENVSVTGVVTEKDGHKEIKASKIEG